MSVVLAQECCKRTIRYTCTTPSGTWASVDPAALGMWGQDLALVPDPNSCSLSANPTWASWIYAWDFAGAALRSPIGNVTGEKILPWVPNYLVPDIGGAVQL